MSCIGIEATQIPKRMITDADLPDNYSYIKTQGQESKSRLLPVAHSSSIA